MSVPEDYSSQDVHKNESNRRRKNKKARTLAIDTSAATIENHDEDVNDKHVEKRNISDDDQDSSEELVVKKKKKKNLPAEPGEKGAKSIRQTKRENHAARLAEAKSVAKDELKQQCMQYLSQWKYHKSNWKFMKSKQGWLSKNKYSPKHVPEEMWSTFLEYFSSAQGNIKKILLDDAKKIIEKADICIEKKQCANEDESTDSTPAEKPDEVTYSRARDIIQHLEE